MFIKANHKKCNITHKLHNPKMVVNSFNLLILFFFYMSLKFKGILLSLTELEVGDTYNVFIIHLDLSFITVVL